MQESYGGPSGLKRLVNAAHQHGLAVVLDVVFNHLGPEGNYLREFGPNFTPCYRTLRPPSPWWRRRPWMSPPTNAFRLSTRITGAAGTRRCCCSTSRKPRPTWKGLLQAVPFDVNLWKPQNVYFLIRGSVLPERQERAGSGDESARVWVEKFRTSGEYLRFRVDP